MVVRRVGVEVQEETRLLAPGSKPWCVGTSLDEHRIHTAESGDRSGVAWWRHLRQHPECLHELLRALDCVEEALVDALAGEDAGIGFANGVKFDSGLTDTGIVVRVDFHWLVDKSFEKDFLEQLCDVEHSSRGVPGSSGLGRFVLGLLTFTD